MKIATESVLLERTGPVARVTLNRPEVYNALNTEMATALQRAIEVCKGDTAVKIVVLTGAEKAFCAGGDVAMINAAPDRRRFLGDLTAVFHYVIADLRLLPKPVIAAVDGVAAGAGLSLAMACDLRIVADTARFKQAYTSNGLTPDGGWTALVTAQIGLSRAAEMLLLDEVFDARRAEQLGIANRVVPSIQLYEEAHEIALRLSRGALTAFAGSKQLLNQRVFPALATQLEFERQMMIECGASPEGVEGVAAFMTKRPANFARARGEE